MPTRRAMIGLIAATLTSGLCSCGKNRKFTCTDTRHLSPGDLHWRRDKGYVEPTPEPGKTCVRCAFYEAPPSAGSCGTCKVLKGPVHPEGYCFDYVPIPKKA